MNRRFVICLPILSLMLFSCGTNKSVWNHTYKSNGEVTEDYHLNISDTNKSAINFLEENFDKVDWLKTGIYENYWTEEGEPIKFSISERNTFQSLKYAIDNCWWNDPTKLDIKKRIDRTTIVIKKTSDLTGTVTFQAPSPTGEGKVDERIFDATDISDNHDGSWLECEFHHANIDPRTYVRSTSFRNIINVKSGIDDSLIRFTFNLIEPIDGVSKFYINSYLVIQEYKTGIPDWGIVLICVGSTLVALGAIAGYLQYRKRHHKY